MKKQLVIIGITLVLLVVGLSGCNEKYPSYDHPLSEMGYRYEPPGGWTWSELDDGIVFYGPTVNGFQVFLAITDKYELDEGKTLNSSIDSVLEQYGTSFTNFTLISRNSRIVNGMNAQEIIFTYSNENINYKLKQLGIEKNAIALSITYKTAIDTFDVYESIVEESISTFTII